MRLKVVGSSSSGNCYVVYNRDEALVIEAGVPLRRLKEAMGFDLSSVCGVLISHSHGDHGGRAKEYIKDAMDCYMPPETAKELSLEGHRVHHLKKNKRAKIGSFVVTPFLLEHDVTCYGYLIDHPDSGLFPFITDAMSIKYDFGKISNILIEANYDQGILDSKTMTMETSYVVHERVVRSHMDISVCKSYLQRIDKSSLNNIVLLHLSRAHSNAESFRREIEEATGRPTWIADKGLDIPFNRGL